MDADLVRDFIERYEQGDPTQGYTRDEALSTFERAAEVASPETLRRAAGQAVDRLSEDQRTEFGRLMGRPVTTRPANDDHAGFGLDDLLAGLLGTAGDPSRERQADYPARRASGSRGTVSMTDVGKVLASPVGRAVIGGIGAFAFKEIMRSRH